MVNRGLITKPSILTLKNLGLMSKKLNIAAYLADAEEQYSGYSGVVEPDDLAFDGEDFLDEQGEWEDYSGAAGGRQAVSPSPYQVSITNSTAGTLTATLFGKNTNLLLANFGSPVGIAVTPSQANVTYVELLQQSAEQPFETSLMRVQSTNTAQITQIVTITSRDANGQQCTVPIITQSYFSANQFQAGILDVPYNVRIDGNTQIQFPVLATTTVVLTFFPSEKINTSRALANLSAVKKYTAPTVPVITPSYPASYPKRSLTRG